MLTNYKQYIMVNLFALLLFAASAGLAMSGNGVITGKVVDKSSGEPLPAVNVILEHTNTGAATDKNGEYEIRNAPHGQFRLSASIIGYKRIFKAITIHPEETVTVNFELEPTILEMAAIVVTGTSTPHLLEDMPVRTEVIPRKVIEQKHASNLAEALSFHTGIQVENNCTNCNFSQVRILGMDGQYSQILIDGDPVVSSLAGVYGLEHFPEEMVDQIEIVKGGGSSLYGAGAVAGVINMITRTPMINQVRIKYQNNTTDGKLDQHMGAVAETVSGNGHSGAYVFGSFRKRNPYDRNDDGFSELGELRNESLGFKWYYQPFTNSELTASFHQIHEERRGGNKFDLPVHEAEIAEWIEHWRSGGALRWAHRPGALFDYRFFYSFSFENRKSYYGGLGGDTPQDQLDALNFYGSTENPLQIGGFQANYRWDRHFFTAGVQYSHDKLQDKTAAETAYYVDTVYKNTGLFLQDELHFGDYGQIVTGIRFDKHSELENWIVSPRLTGKLNLGKGIALRAAVTSGFKPPQTYDEDLHLCGIEGDQRIIRNSLQLKEERSYSVCGGLEYTGNIKQLPVMFSLTGFHTRLDDSFSEQFISKQGSIEYWERINSDGAKVKGVEADLGIRPLGMVELRGGITYKKSRYDSPLEDFATRNFLRTPDLTGNLRLTWSPRSSVDLYILSNYLGKADVPHEIALADQDEPLLALERSDSYIQMDLGMTWRLPLNHGLNMKINLGVKNAFDSYQDNLDSGPDRDPAYTYGPTRPRTIFWGLETAF